ncbi:MAG: cell division protein FtsA [Candidatus Moranbacteria bacterium]|nr:cell division protein FtsA [Candidatus Moranbacteria bacterium]
MSKKSNIIAVDLGSSNIRIAVSQYFPEEDDLRIIGIETVPADGMRRGAVIDLEEASKSIASAINFAEKKTGANFESVTASISGSDIVLQNSKGVVAVGRADGEVAEDDIKRVLEAAQTISMPLNREIVHISPRSYRLDDQDSIRDPLGMNGVRLEADVMIIEDSVNHIKNISKSIYNAGVEIDNLVFSPLAAAESVLTRKQKELGVAVVDIGAGVTSIAVFEEGDLIHAAVLPVGAGHITNDIAIGLRTSIDVAEKIKLEFGTASMEGVDYDEEIDLSLIDSNETESVSRYHVMEIIDARMEEIFNMVNDELRAIRKDGLLPAGVVLVGGGSELPGVVEFSKKSLGLPAQIGIPRGVGGLIDKIDSPSFATVTGLLLWEKNHGSFKKSGRFMKDFGGVKGNVSDATEKAKKWIGKFLP